jgi:hypothetical protein
VWHRNTASQLVFLSSCPVWVILPLFCPHIPTFSVDSFQEGTEFVELKAHSLLAKL